MAWYNMICFAFGKYCMKGYDKCTSVCACRGAVFGVLVCVHAVAPSLVAIVRAPCLMYGLHGLRLGVSRTVWHAAS